MPVFTLSIYLLLSLVYARVLAIFCMRIFLSFMQRIFLVPHYYWNWNFTHRIKYEYNRKYNYDRLNVILKWALNVITLYEFHRLTLSEEYIYVCNWKSFANWKTAICITTFIFLAMEEKANGFMFSSHIFSSSFSTIDWSCR